MLYRAMLAARRHPRVERYVARYERLRGRPSIRPESEWLEEFVVPGKSFADIGGMWGINGEVAVRAAELGASPVTLVDFWSSEEFEQKQKDRGVEVGFIQGAGDDPKNVAALGQIDRVWCWGVMYHHPAPGYLFGALRMITKDRLLLEGRTIPDIPGAPNAAVFWPYMTRAEAQRWNQQRYTKVTQMGIDTAYDPEAKGANDFWGMTTGAVVALARTYGLECVRVARSPKGPQRHVFEFEPVPVPEVANWGEAPPVS